MPAAEPTDTTHLDIRPFLDAMRGERYRAFVIHGRPLVGKTTFARRLARLRADAIYLDVLDLVASNREQAATVDRMDAGDLRDLALAQAEQARARLVLVDEFDFLVHVWGGDLTAFQDMVRTLPSTRTEAAIGFVMQTQPSLEEWRLVTSVGQSRVLRLEQLQELRES